MSSLGPDAHSAKPKRREQLMSNTIGNDVVISNEETKEVYFLNSTGRFIWQQCNGTQDYAQIAALLKSLYQIQDEVDLVADIQEFCENLSCKGLIE